MIVYLSGMISNNGTLPQEAIEANIARFNATELELKTMGHRVLNPTRHGVRDHQQSTWADYMKLALKDLLDADAVLLLPGWSQSRGATLERTLAGTLGIHVYYRLEEIKKVYE